MINRQPSGLLGFLGIKNFGKNPQRLTEELVGTWDLSRQYLEQSIQWGQVITAAVAADAGYNAAAQPPDGEVWIVHDASVLVVCGAGDSLRIGLARADASNIHQVKITDPVVVTAASTAWTCYVRSTPIYLCLGQSLGWQMEDPTIVGTVDVTFQYRYTVMQM